MRDRNFSSAEDERLAGFDHLSICGFCDEGNSCRSRASFNVVFDRGDTSFDNRDTGRSNAGGTLFLRER